MAVLSNTSVRAGASAAGGASGYQIEKSLRFNPDDTPELTRTPSSGDSKQFTISFWAKLCSPDATQMIIQTDDTYDDLFRFYISSGKFRVHQWHQQIGGGTYFWEYISTPVFRDTSAWYHVVFSYDARSFTAADRARTWINGVQITDWDTVYHPDQHDDAGWNKNIKQRIGREYTTTYGSYYKYDGLLAEFYSIDGQSLDPSSFGKTDATTGQWVAKEYEGTYGRQHNQAEVWSDDMSGTSNSGVYTNLFDGTMTGYEVGGDNQTLTYTPDGGISATTSIRINLWQSSGTYASAADITVNGSSIKSAIGTAMGTGSVGGWIDIGTTSLTTLTWSNPTGGNNDYRLFAIEVDGKMLTDTGVTPPADNSFYLKFNGTDLGEDSSGNDNDWTATNLVQTVTGTSVESGSYVGNLTYTNTASDYGSMDAEKLKGFDTNTATWWNISTGGGTTTATWTPSSAVDTSNGGFRCYHYGSWHIGGTGYEIQFNINGTGWYTVGSLSNANGHADAVPQWWTVTVPSNSLTSFATKTISANAGWGTSGWSAIEVNGEVLKESGDENTVDISNDSPTTFDDDGNGTGNYCTLNPLHHLATATLTQGNLKTTSSNPAFSTFLLTSGKWYVEHTCVDTGYNLCFSQVDHASGDTPSSTGSKSIGYYSNGTFYWGAGSAALAASYTTGDVLAAAIDMDSSTIKVYKNNSLQTTIDFSTGTYHRFTEGMYVSQFNGTGWWNFGQRPFVYTPPTGYKALNTYNLPDPVIKDPGKYFDTKLYTGTGASHAITGLNFSPDFVWIKKYTSASHAVFDAVRGVQERLKTDSNAEEGTDATTLTAFGTEGFTLSTHDDINQNTDSYVSWNWDAGTANKVNTEIDQSQDWSSTSNLGGSTTEAAKAFLGYNFLSGTGTVAYDNTGNNVLTTAPLSGVTKLEIMTNRTHSGATDGTKITIDGTAYYDAVLAANGWSEVNLGGATISNTSGDSIYIKDEGGSASALWAVRVNGKVLVDSGNSLASVPSIYAGGLNSTVYDQSKTWSDESHSSTGDVWSNPPNSASLAPANLFDGNVDTYVGPYNSGALTVSFGQTFSGTKTYSVYWRHWAAGETIKDQAGNTLYTTSGQQDLAWFDFEGTDVSSLVFTANGNANASELCVIKVDGITLLDDDVTAPTNTPSIASTYRANPEAGFSIVTYTGNGITGATVAHGLGAKPDFFIIKSRNYQYSWIVYHKNLGNGNVLRLENSWADSDEPTAFNDTDPTSTVITFGNMGDTNVSGTNNVMYCWSEVEGYSKFGTYTGNGNTTDGPFCYCGFRPRYIITKGEDANDWFIRDTARSTYNVVDNPLRQDTGAEYSGREADILSNGFKLRAATEWAQVNTSGVKYHWAAFAESPFKYANAR